jgi:hypothetical protein
MTNSKLPFLLAAAVVGFLASCAEMETHDSKLLLSAAGFRARTPKTAEQREIYSSLPDNKIERAIVNGKVFYVFKDEKAGVAYVGREQEHRRYEQLCLQQHVERKPEEQMDKAQASKYYKYWGVGATLFK